MYQVQATLVTVLQWTIQIMDTIQVLEDTGAVAAVEVDHHSTGVEEEEETVTTAETTAETTAFITMTGADLAAIVADETATVNVDVIVSRGIGQETDREIDQGIGRGTDRGIEGGEDLVGIGTTGLRVLDAVGAAVVAAAGVEATLGVHSGKESLVTAPEIRIVVMKREAAPAPVHPIRDPTQLLILGACANVTEKVGNVLVGAEAVAGVGKAGKRSATTEAKVGL